MTLLKKREEEVIREDSIDKEFAEKIKEVGADSVEYCFQCGTCTGSCPSGRRTAYKVRQIIRKLNMGMKEVLADPALWMCTTCYTCQERCPRRVKLWMQLNWQEMKLLKKDIWLTVIELLHHML